MTKKEKMAKQFFYQKAEELGLVVDFIINRGQIHLECAHTNTVAAYNFTTNEVLVEEVAIFIYSIESTYDMILHELAHAIAGRSAGHGEEFVAVCKAIGCKGYKGVGNYYAPDMKVRLNKMFA